MNGCISLHERDIAFEKQKNEVHPLLFILTFTRSFFHFPGFGFCHCEPYKIDRIRKTLERIRLKLSDTEQAKNISDSSPNAEIVPDKILVKEEGNKIFVMSSILFS